MEAWGIYQTWSECEKLEGKVDEAADDIEDAYYDNVDLNSTVTEYLDNITYVSDQCDYEVRLVLAIVEFFI